MRCCKAGVVLLAALAFAEFGFAQFASTETDVPNAVPANPDLTPEARALLQQIDAVSGHSTFTGEHNFPNSVSRWSDRVYDLTGKFPAVFGQDFGFAGGHDKDSVEGRPSMIKEVEREYQQGAIIALTWHAVRPINDEPVTFKDSVLGHLTDFEWDELLTPGTDLYNRWVEQVDAIAGYLRQLQAAGVPVLFRPYHEMNGNWFWWGGRLGPHGSAALYRQLYDRFVHVHHLNNLVWVWNVSSPSVDAVPITDYFPGVGYVDVITMDTYGEFKQSYYDSMLALAKDKPIALAEVGAMPTLNVLASQPRWAYFMMWSGFAESANTPGQLQTMFHTPNLLNRGDAPLTKHADPVEPLVIPATSSPSPQVRTLLARIYAAEGKRVLSGQLNSANAPEAASQKVAQEIFRSPAIYGADLDTSHGPDSANAVIKTAMEQSATGAIVSLRWLPPSPAVSGESGSAARFPMQPETTLTDFEWKELLTPNTDLYKNWCAQVDKLAAQLEPLAHKGIAVLWDPLPDANVKQYWWADRPGIRGSAALYRMLFDRLVTHDKLHNLVWIWEVMPSDVSRDGTRPFEAFFPGYLYVDALQLRLTQTASRNRAEMFFAAQSLGKPIGVSTTREVPDVALFHDPGETSWSWFLLGSEAVIPDANAESTQALRRLYRDVQVASRP